MDFAKFEFPPRMEIPGIELKNINNRNPEVDNAEAMVKEKKLPAYISKACKLWFTISLLMPSHNEF